MQSYERYAALVDDLPPLVRKQRTLEAQLARLAPIVDGEKAVRKSIDALLVAVHLEPGDGVTCNGYDVQHHERKGQSWLNPDTILAKLVAAGVDQGLVIRVLAESTERGDPSQWATVKPSKGAKVRR